MLRRLLPLAVAVVPLAAAAQVPPRVSMAPPACIPAEGNAPVAATAVPMPGGAELRVFFRRHGYGDFYWVPVEGEGANGSPWAVLPKPEPDNHEAEIYAAVVAADGSVLGQSKPVVVPVEGGCDVELTAEQMERAATMTVGETSLAQRLRKVAWWRCDGIIERVDANGEHRDDEACAPIAWWMRPELLAPFPLIGAGIITTVTVDDGGEEAPELSPAQP